jgi:WD40 repeat protein
MQVFELPNPTNLPGTLWYSPALMPRALAFSPDGRLLAGWDNGCSFVVDTRTGTVRLIQPARNGALAEVPGIGFTADGKRVVAVHSAPAQLCVHDAETGTGADVRHPAFKQVVAVEPGPGGRLVYVSVVPKPGRTHVVPWDPLTGETMPALVPHKGCLQQLALSADARWLAGSERGFVRVWDIGGPKPPVRAARQLPLEAYVRVTGLALSADGAFVAASGSGLGVWLWNVKTCEMGQLAPDRGAFTRELAFHPARPLLACSGGTPEVAFWDAVSRTELKRFAWDWGPAEPVGTWWKANVVRATCFSPDGLRCAAAAGTGKVIVWDVDV